jgi:hypothetical protein
MDTQTALIVVSVSALFIIVALVLFYRSQAAQRRQFNRRVVATISQIKVEASTMSSWWVIITQWSDPQSGETLTFRSPRLKFPPKHQIGERITVEFNAEQPRHYRMEL